MAEGETGLRVKRQGWDLPPFIFYVWCEDTAVHDSVQRRHFLLSRHQPTVVPETAAAFGGDAPPMMELAAASGPRPDDATWPGKGSASIQDRLG